MAEGSEELREFLYYQIENIDRLRILLLMHKEPVEWRVEALSARLYIPPDKVTAELQILKDKGFINSSKADVYLYTADARHHPQVQQIVLLDQEKPVTLINLIYQRPPDRLKSFADAFKLKKKES